MTYRIQGEAPFQVLSSNFSIGPSNEGYTLQISADGSNYSNLFSVGANVTRMVTGVANGSFYRLSGNNSEVTVNWQRQCNDGGGGGSTSGGTADYATSAGTAIISNSTRLLDGVPDFPEIMNVGDVVAIGSVPTRGAKSGAKSPEPAPMVGVFQYDGTNWNKIEGGGGSSAYKIELSTSHPDEFIQEDYDNVNAFFAAVEDDPSIIDGAYILTDGEIFNCVYAEYNEEVGYFSFSLAYPDSIFMVNLTFEDGLYIEGNYYENYFTSIFTTTEFPADPYEGLIVNYDNGEGTIGLYRYNGEDWVPYGGGDNTILKTSDEMPVDIEVGDVYATHIDAEGVVIGDDWTDSGEQNIQYDREGDGNPQAIRIAVSENDVIHLSWAIEPWDFGQDITIGDGVLILDDDYGFSGNGTSELRFVDESWMEITGGKSVIVFLDNGTLYLYTEDNSMIWIYGVSDNNTGNNVYEGEVTPSHPAFDNVYQAVEDEGGNTVGSRLAKASELPNKINLVPDGEPNYGNILKYDDKPRWVHPAALIPPIFINIPTEGNYQDYPTYLKRSGQEEFEWTKLERNSIEAVSALPTTSIDGDVYAYANASGYGIVQAQSGTPVHGWMEGTTEITGYTQIRVPYTASDTTFLEFSFVGYSDLHNLWWHYEEGENPHWDGDNVPIDEQVDGEFSGVDGDGVSISCVRDGDYLVVTFGEVVSSAVEIENTEIYGTYVTPNYVEMATMDYVNNTLGNIETILQSI